MTGEEMVTLIRAAIPVSGGIWADLGAGSGNFTRALRTLLSPEGIIYAVDQAATGPIALGDAAPTVHPRTADFTQAMDLPNLDGVLMANALHFVRNQAAVLTHLCGYLRHDGQFVVVDYELDRPLSRVSYPVPFRVFEPEHSVANWTEPDDRQKEQRQQWNSDN